MMMVNYKVHRVRFIPYIPKAIHCIAVEGTRKPRIAVSRYFSIYHTIIHFHVFHVNMIYDKFVVVK